MTLLLLFGCQDYYVDFTAVRSFSPGTGEDTDEADTEVTIEAVEECNGLDDDGDGTIDEGYMDGDANGRVDCLDQTCPELLVATGGSIALLETCPGPPNLPPQPVRDPWSLSVQWTFNSAGAAGYETVVAPVIGNLDDDNGDGRIDGDDVPDVVFTTTAAHLVALDGSTGEVKWQMTAHSAGLLNPALGDVDADGLVDIVVFGIGGVPSVYEGDGALKWRAAATGWASAYSTAGVVDLEGDGQPEVIADDMVLDGITGALRFRLPTTSSAMIRSVAVADIDRDGDQEIFYDGMAFDSDGTPIWETRGGPALSNWPLVVQADADDEGEIVFVTDELTVYDTDGTELASVQLGEVPGSAPPCAGDFDGDGEMEVAVATHYGGAIAMYELDGTVRWSLPLTKDTIAGGCSGFDLDGDGALEVLYPGEDDFFVFDGRTGETLARWSQYASATPIHYASVADIDKDGHAEIVLASNGATSDLWVTALENDGEGWPAAGPTWANHDFSMTNINVDGSVPQAPEPSWLRNKVYRARTAVDGSLLASDLFVALTDVCVADCEYGPVRVVAQVGNQGLVDVPEGAILAIYADDNGQQRLLAEMPLPFVRAGESLGEITFELSPADIGASGFHARVNESGGVYECDTANNQDAWSDVFCP